MGEIKRGPIDGVTLSNRRKIVDERGAILHHLKNTDPEFLNFGESYISTILEGSTKAWKRHHRVTQFLVVPIGNVRLMFFDDRPQSPTQNTCWEVVLGEENYKLLRVPPMVWYGFQGLGSPRSAIVNCSTEPHDPNEMDRRELDDPQMPRF